MTVSDPAWADTLVRCVSLHPIWSGRGMAPRYPVEEVEAVIVRAVRDSFREVRAVPAICYRSVSFAIAKTEVPLSYHSGVVARLAEKSGEGWAVFFDERITLHTKENPVLEGRAPAVTAGHECVA